MVAKEDYSKWVELSLFKVPILSDLIYNHKGFYQIQSANNLLNFSYEFMNDQVLKNMKLNSDCANQ